MDYEQKYKEALERAREFQKSKDGLCVLTAESIFPELAESEDERIKETLIDYFKIYKKQEECGIKTFFGIPTDNIIAWLEKQGEKKVPFVNFNAKDWYVSKVDGKIHNINISSEKQGEKKPAWSEEDEEYMRDVIAFLEDARDCRQNALDCIEWMKQLKERLS